MKNFILLMFIFLMLISLGVKAGGFVEPNNTITGKLGSKTSTIYKFDKVAGNKYSIAVISETGNVDLYGHYKRSQLNTDSAQYKSTRSSGVDKFSFSASNSGSYYVMLDTSNSSRSSNSYVLFISDGNKLQTVSLVYPSKNDSINTTQEHFEWNTVAGASDYRLQVSPTNFTSSSKDCSSCLYNDLVEYPNYAQLVRNFSAGRYYWRVRAGNQYTEQGSNWSSVRVLDVELPDLGRVTLSSPSSGHHSSSEYIDFKWNSVSGANSYTFQISENNQFSTSSDGKTCYNCAKDVDVSSTNKRLYGLSPDKKYYWRVRAENTSTGQVSSSWSGLRTVYVDAPKPIVSNVSLSKTPVTPGERRVVSWTSEHQHYYFFHLYNAAGTSPINTSAFLSSSCASAPPNAAEQGCLGQVNPSTSTSAYWDVPSNIPPDTYTIKVVAWNEFEDAGAAFSAPFEIASLEPEITQLELSTSTVTAGEQLHIGWLSQNQERAFVYLYDANTNTAVNSSSFLSDACESAGSQAAIDGCLTQVESDLGFNWTIPDNLAAGSYKIKLVIWNKNNTPKGQLSSQFTVEAAAPVVPNPVIDSIWLDKNTVQAGDTLSINWNSSQQHYYFFNLYDIDAMTPINTSAFLSDSCIAAPANAAEQGCLGQENPSSAQNVTWTVPDNVAVGSYRIQVVIWNTEGVPTASSSSIFSVQAPNTPIEGISEWAKETVQYLIDHNIIDLPANGNVRGTEKATRAEIATMLFRALGNRDNKTAASNFAQWAGGVVPSPFVDVQDASTWYYPAVTYLASLVYENDVSLAPVFDNNNSRFNPADTLSRRWSVKALMETWNQQLFSGSPSSPYSDLDEDDDGAGYVYRARQLGVVSYDNTFRPNDAVLRQEFFVMLHRLMTQNIEPQPTPTTADFFRRSPQARIGSRYEQPIFYGVVPPSFTVDDTGPYKKTDATGATLYFYRKLETTVTEGSTRYTDELGKTHNADHFMAWTASGGSFIDVTPAGDIPFSHVYWIYPDESAPRNGVAPDYEITAYLGDNLGTEVSQVLSILNNTLNPSDSALLPTVSLNTLPALVGHTRQRISGTAQDAESDKSASHYGVREVRVDYSLDGGAWETIAANVPVASDGSWEVFWLVPDASGTIRVRAQARNLSGNVANDTDSTSIQPLTLVSGYVMDDRGNALVNAQVRLSGARSVQTLADEQGYFAFLENLPLGSYQLQATHAGQSSALESVFLTASAPKLRTVLSVDVNAPNLLVQSSPYSPIAGEEVLFYLSANEALAATPTLQLNLPNGQQVSVSLSLEADTWTGRYSLSASLDGTATVFVSARDTAGNAANYESSLQVLAASVPAQNFSMTVVDAQSGSLQIVSDSGSLDAASIGAVQVNGQAVNADVQNGSINVALAGVADLSQAADIVVLGTDGQPLFSTCYPFPDVCPSEWHSLGMMYLWQRDILPLAVGENALPLGTVSRADFVSAFVQLMAQQLNLDASLFAQPSSAAFADLPVTHAAAPYVQYLLDMNLDLSCDAAGNFCPDAPIVRADAIKFVAPIYAGVSLEAFMSGQQPNALFDDVTEANAWYFPYVYTVAAEQWLHGYDDNSFKPLQALTKGEMAKLLMLATEGALSLFPDKQPAIGDVSPTSCLLNQPTVFTLDGVNLPDTTRFVLEACSNVMALSRTESAWQFRCTPSVLGLQQGRIEDANTGEVLYRFAVDVADVLLQAPPPGIEQITSNSMLLRWDEVAPWYELWRSSELDGYASLERVYCGTAASYLDTGLVSETTYLYQTKAGNSNASCTDGSVGWSELSTRRGNKTDVAGSSTAPIDNEASFIWNAPVEDELVHGASVSVDIAVQDADGIASVNLLVLNDAGALLEKRALGSFSGQTSVIENTAITPATLGFANNESVVLRLESSDQLGYVMTSDPLSFSWCEDVSCGEPVPTAPQAELTVLNSSSIEVMWAATGSVHALLQCSASGTNCVEVYCGSDTSYLATDLASGVTYSYQLQAGNSVASCDDKSVGWSGVSGLVSARTEESVEPTPQPSVVSFGDITSSSLQMSWDDNAPIYIVLRSSSLDSYNSTQRVYCGANNNFVDTGLIAETGYAYSVKAGNSSASCNDEVTGWSEPSQLRGSKTLAVPVEPTPQPSVVSFGDITSSSLQMSWDDNAPIYIVLRSSSLDSYNSTQRVYCGANNNFVDTGLIAETGYAYSVKAGNSSASCNDEVTGWSEPSQLRGSKTLATQSAPVELTISPSSVILGETTLFTIKGKNLPDSIAVWIDQCADLRMLTGNSTQWQFECVPSYSIGTKAGVVKDKSGGDVLLDFSIIVKDSNQTPTVTSVSPSTAIFGEPTVFTIKGTNLPNSIAAWIDQCADLKMLTGNSTQWQFECVPSYATGTKAGVVKDKSGGNVLLDFSIEVVAMTSMQKLTGNFVSLATGGYHTCAANDAGQLWCWGENSRG